MTKDIIPQLASLLDGLVVTGDITLTFTHVPWGRHLDRRNYPADNGLITCEPIGHPRRRSNIGGRASRGTQVVDVHAFFEDNAGITDLDAWKKLVRKAIEDAVRAEENTFDDSFSVFVANDADRSGLLGESTSVLKNEIVVTVEALTTEVY